MSASLMCLFSKDLIKINRGEIHAIMGRNGSGKSTLANVIMGHPSYEITDGHVFYRGQALEDLEVHERAQGCFCRSSILHRYRVFKLVRS